VIMIVFTKHRIRSPQFFDFSCDCLDGTFFEVLCEAVGLYLSPVIPIMVARSPWIDDLAHQISRPARQNRRFHQNNED